MDAVLRVLDTVIYVVIAFIGIGAVAVGLFLWWAIRDIGRKLNDGN